MLIYIRHAEDDTSDIYKHDGSLTKVGKKQAKYFANYLIKKYGYPKIIYTSPFYRSRETAKKMKKLVPKSVEIFADSHVSKYFTQSQQKSPDVRKDTLKYNIPILETKHDVYNRVTNHFHHLKHHHTDDIVWIITHGIIVHYISKYVGQKTKGNVNYLQYIAIKDKKK